jgi:pimeloyl-ACP methyl ester carboxylesterase
MQPRSLRVRSADGLGLHVLEWSTEGVPFLLVHGFGHEAHVWDELAPAIAPYYRTLALDLRGHGESEADPEQHYTYEAQVEDLEAVTRELNIERLILMGHSLGGRIAALFAAHHPECMAGLILVDSGPEHDPRGSLRIRLELRRVDDETFDSVEAYRSALARAYPVARPETLARMARHGLRRREDGRFVPKLDPRLRRYAATQGSSDERGQSPVTDRLWAALEQISCPTLVVRGAASDVLSADVADRMQEVLADGRLATIPHAGHSVMIDNPEGFRVAVSDFVLSDEG